MDTSSPVDIVAFSMGGLVVRSWIWRQGGRALELIGTFVSLASPHYGTSIAQLSDVLTGLAAELAESQGLPGEPASELVRQLVLTTQIYEMKYGSDLTWQLHKHWETAPTELKQRTLTVIGTRDEAVDPAAAMLPGAAHRFIRDRSHFLGGCLASIRCVNKDHPTFNLVRSFLRDSRLDGCSEPECTETPPSREGLLLVGLFDIRTGDRIKRDIPFPYVLRSRCDGSAELSLVFPNSDGGTVTITDLDEGCYEARVLAPLGYEAPAPFLTAVGAAETRVDELRLSRGISLTSVVLTTLDRRFRVGDRFVLLASVLEVGERVILRQSEELTDAYLWVDMPGGQRLFLLADRTFTSVVTPILGSMRVRDASGTILDIVMPNIEPGTYQFSAVLVRPGGDPRNPADYVSNLATETVEVLVSR